MSPPLPPEHNRQSYYKCRSSRFPQLLRKSVLITTVIFLKIHADGQKPKVINATAKIQSKLENWCKHTLTLILTIIPNLSPRIIQEKLLGLSIERILTNGVTRMDTLNQFGHIMFITQRYIK